MTGACGIYVNGQPCGATPARQYLTGMCCPAHTPAAVAGRPEPGRTATNLPKLAPSPMSASRVNDDRAIASGKRRSTPARYREAQARTTGENQ